MYKEREEREREIQWRGVKIPPDLLKLNIKKKFMRETEEEEEESKEEN